MESPSDRHDGGLVGLSARVSGNGKGVVLESDGRISEALENGVHGEGSGSGFVDNENIGVNVGVSTVDTNVSEVGKLHAIDLVVDLNHFSRKVPYHNSPEMDAGLVANVAESNEKPANYEVELTEKEGHYEVSDLVWGKVKSHPWWPGLIIDPSASTYEARKYFKKDGCLIAYFGDKSFAWNESFNIKPFRVNFCKMDEQSNAESFRHAVDCALQEAARRLEYGLACLCLSEGVFGKIKSQNFVNTGIRKESSRIDGGDRFSTVASFKPAKVVQSVLDLAKCPFGVNRLEVSAVRSQLSAFNRWKGYHQLPSNQVLDGSDDEYIYDEHMLDSIMEEKASKDAITCENVTNNRGSKARGRVPRNRKRMFDDSLSPSKKMRCLTDLMSNSRSNSSDEEYKPKKRGRKRKAVQSNGSGVRIQSQTTEDFLSQICQAARNPMEKQHSLDSLIRLLTDFRNYRLEMNSESREDENGVDQSEETVQQMEVTEAAGFTGIKDSYWTDRFIEIQDSYKPVLADLNPQPNKENIATALILKFTNLDSLPSVTNLNKIFGRYGPLQEPGTQILKKKQCVKVVFERRSDAETAFSSSGKFSIFGPALVSYCLDYSPTPRKTATVGTKHDKNEKGVKAAKAVHFDN